jgi:hypothetical protein
MKFVSRSFWLLVLLVLPVFGIGGNMKIAFVKAEEGLVTCDGVTVPCDACTLVLMADKVIQWLFTILISLTIMMIMYAGFRLVVSQGNSHAWEESKGMLTNIVVGFIIVLSAWLIVDTVMKGLVNPNAKLGMWNQLDVNCGAGK